MISSCICKGRDGDISSEMIDICGESDRKELVSVEFVIGMLKWR